MSENSATPLTMIGLGPMGRAMVRRFLAAGHPTTVWNRTAARADDLVAEGAVRVATVADAVAANRLVLVSLTDYAAMYDVLEPAERELAGRVIVNLVSNALHSVRAKMAMRVDFVPRVSLSTRALADSVELRVRDNGLGIPEDLREKIFVPFFTTKAGRHGTGLARANKP